MTVIEYRNRRIELSPGGRAELTIDGVAQDVAYDREADAYSAAALPYQLFADLEELARAVIDRSDAEG